MGKMETLLAWISAHASQAHWLLFGTILLAGINLPISIDILLAGAAVLAATLVPHHFWHLYLAGFLGCYFSAWIAYAVGRFILPKIKWFSPHRIDRIGSFYRKHGPWALFLGRFIPFGVRNCIFMSSGMSRVPFLRFILWDFPACLLWSSLLFYLFFTLGKNVPALLSTINVIIFLIFSVTVIAVLWYKRRNR